MKRIPVTLNEATRIILAAYGPSFQLDTEGVSVSTRCRLVHYAFCGIRIFRTDVLYEAECWYDLLVKAVPYFHAEFTEHAKDNLSQYCGRLLQRRKAKEDKLRNT